MYSKVEESLLEPLFHDLDLQLVCAFLVQVALDLVEELNGAFGRLRAPWFIIRLQLYWVLVDPLQILLGVVHLEWMDGAIK